MLAARKAPGAQARIPEEAERSASARRARRVGPVRAWVHPVRFARRRGSAVRTRTALRRGRSRPAHCATRARARSSPLDRIRRAPAKTARPDSSSSLESERFGPSRGTLAWGRGSALAFEPEEAIAPRCAPHQTQARARGQRSLDSKVAPARRRAPQGRPGSSLWRELRPPTRALLRPKPFCARALWARSPSPSRSCRPRCAALLRR